MSMRHLSIFFFVLLVPNSVLAEGTLQFLSPPSGTRVSPGNSIQVVVQANPPSDFTTVLLAGKPWGGPGPVQAAASTMSFNVIVPKTLARGAIGISAVGKSNSSGSLIEASPALLLVVEDDSATPLKSLQIEPARIHFRYPGEAVSITVSGIQPDGSEVNLDGATSLVVNSDDPTVAKLLDDGRIAATGPGSTNIHFSYSGLSRVIPIEVRAQQRKGDFDSDNDVDSQDLQELKGEIGQLATSSTDALDLNGDGRITSADADMLVQLCTRRRCAQSNDLAYGMLPDTTPPIVQITSPTNGATVSGTVTVTATATDNDLVKGVQFLLDGSNLGAEDILAPYSATWDARKATQGTHVLRARARDDSGNVTTSSPVSVTIGKGTQCVASKGACTQNSQCCSAVCLKKVCT